MPITVCNSITSVHFACVKGIVVTENKKKIERSTHLFPVYLDLNINFGELSAIGFLLYIGS